MSTHSHNNLLELLHEADRALVEDTPEAKEELATLVRNLCREYHVVRAVKRGAADAVGIIAAQIRETVDFMRINKVHPRIVDGKERYKVVLMVDAN